VEEVQLQFVTFYVSQDIRFSFYMIVTPKSHNRKMVSLHRVWNIKELMDAKSYIGSLLGEIELYK
jgi:hypothetical protein